ncbi:hypothetical protein [Mesomycoplasma lagogenitalium]|uniref:DUF2975 domain-containing protein n=1 Tax=Mesomycoplasma lagogenitalium TaxID=171286 RepID=A0ABY8LU37_9BACT|nr:hypothetical protein [Mesomycoplasma lagogenitalium]WGI36749.1 hypothetical protein QEG99_00465 [Mesomycoplasma lagogenitalium]
MKYFQTYTYRKITFILMILVSIISFGLFFGFYQSALDYLEEEKNYIGEKFNNENSQIYAQLPIFRVIWVLFSLLVAIIIVISIISTVNYLKQTNNNLLFLKINIFLVIFAIILISILLSFQPPIAETLLRQERIIKTLNPPDYTTGWIIFVLLLTTGIFGLFSLKNFGYLKNDKKIIL